MFLSQVLSKTDHLMKSFFYSDNDKVRFYTGLHSFQVLMKTFHFNEPRVKRHSMHLNKFQEFIMELMKLRLDVPHLDLVYRFDVSRPVVTRVISAWLVIMDVRLSPLISWSTCDALHKTMPQCFVDSFGYKTTVIIQGRRSRSDHSDLGRTKNLAIYGQSLVFSEFWSDQ